MPSTDKTSRRRRKSPNDTKSTLPADQEGMPRSPRGQTTSLEGISILPRTPKTATVRANGFPGWSSEDSGNMEEVEMSLLADDERRQAAEGMTVEEEQEYLSRSEKKPVSSKDKKAIALLIILCWALTLLSHENLPYASTCQTIGLNTGYFASFTVFLALNSESFV
ncbi:hypothetical protein PHLCEN_2v969 [Hermanssonia centrifuga]|uniref:Uncharacterized protein n=1 Tax=Hermanssonia centrifuga TaxID=98765 RepID=A0A2R6S4I5_9APHY|nr:hypothetical protein PHLCEN_2v969 [Hermanssonia centrifuga]